MFRKARLVQDLLILPICADDIALIAPDELKLQQMLDVVTSWCSEWKLHINASKTQIVHFRNPSVQRSNFIFTCSNSNIEYVESYKYLGLWFDEHMNMNKAVRELAKSASRALGALYGKFVSCGSMTYSRLRCVSIYLLAGCMKVFVC
jgi:hypothetical protein